MTRLESIARDLAAVMSPEGESDWRRFTGLAEDVGAQLYEQLETAFPDPSRSPGAHGGENSAAAELR